MASKVQDYELLLRVRADIIQAINGLDNVRKKIDSGAQSADSLAKKGDAASRALRGVGSAIAAIGIAKLTQDYLRAADASSNMAAKIRLVTESAEQQAAVQKRLFDLAQSTGADLDTTVDLYVRLAQSSDTLRKNQELLIDTTRLVGQTLVLSGADTGTATGVVRQFSQAMASGVLRGDEFNSIMEGSPRLAKAMADGLGVPVGALRAMAAQGELTADKVIASLQSQRATVDREFGSMPLTVARATQEMRNSLLNLVGDADATSGASRDLAHSVESLAQTLQSPDVKAGFAFVITSLVDIANYAASAIGYLQSYRTVAADALTLTSDENAALESLYSRRATLEDRLARTKQELIDVGGLTAAQADSSAAVNGINAQLVALDALIAKKRELADQAAPAAASPTAAASTSTGPQQLPDITVTAPSATAAEKAARQAVAAADALASANDKLAATVDGLREQTLGPTAKIWNDYSKAVRAAAEAGGEAIAKGADAATVQKQVAEAVDYAAKVRSDALAQHADEARQAYEQLRESLRTPTEVKLEEAIAQVKQLNDALAAGVIQAPEYQQQLARIGQNSVIGAPHYQGVDAAVGGAAGELGKNYQAEDALNTWLEDQQRVREEDIANEQAYAARMLEVNRQYSAEKKAIDQARQQLALAVASEGFANLAGLAKAAYGEQSKQYRVLFALSKAFAIAQAAVSLATNVAKASEVGFPYNIPFIIGAFAQGASIAGILAGANFSGGGEAGGGAGYANGGHIRGPGTGTSDSIQIRASNGEYMQREAAVRYYGVDFMDRVNNLELPRYATGGLITDQFEGSAQSSTAGFSAFTENPRLSAPTASGSGAAAEPSTVKVILAMDKEQLAEELLNTAAGERVTVHHVGNNPRQIQGKWRS